jgi:hypothetical protein
MSKTIINGIDVGEEIRYCNNCSNLGLDFKTGKFYCGLSNRKDELPEILSCENFSSNCYIKRLQEENEKLKEYIKDLQVRKDKYYLKTLDYEAKISYLIQTLKEIRDIVKPIKENTCFGMNCGAIDWVLNEINEVLNNETTR